MLFPTLEPSSLPIVVPSLTKDIQTEQLLCWSGMTDTEHSRTSGSNEVEVSDDLLYQRSFQSNKRFHNQKQRVQKYKSVHSAVRRTWVRFSNRVMPKWFAVVLAAIGNTNFRLISIIFKQKLYLDTVLKILFLYDFSQQQIEGSHYLNTKHKVLLDHYLLSGQVPHKEMRYL